MSTSPSHLNMVTSGCTKLGLDSKCRDQNHSGYICFIKESVFIAGNIRSLLRYPYMGKLHKYRKLKYYRELEGKGQYIFTNLNL